ncbi:hypothetical protein OH76DRAFT_1488408 [Lentinus brumalis]|uniref:Zn(2)-C6 fungal-type domain-containing protein n=1 Tax=Lentinus brumalis TaxID=2498619 RepID=A0A371CR74_9APHY|nr:hypothetical protein OH76DRAFT_1488408 [Polyporus brumalis]
MAKHAREDDPPDESAIPEPPHPTPGKRRVRRVTKVVKRVLRAQPHSDVTHPDQRGASEPASDGEQGADATKTTSRPPPKKPKVAHALNAAVSAQPAPQRAHATQDALSPSPSKPAASKGKQRPPRGRSDDEGSDDEALVDEITEELMHEGQGKKGQVGADHGHGGAGVEQGGNVEDDDDDVAPDDPKDVDFADDPAVVDIESGTEDDSLALPPPDKRKVSAISAAPAGPRTRSKASKATPSRGARPSATSAKPGQRQSRESPTKGETGQTTRTRSKKASRKTSGERVAESDDADDQQYRGRSRKASRDDQAKWPFSKPSSEGRPPPLWLFDRADDPKNLAALLSKMRDLEDARKVRVLNTKDLGDYDCIQCARSQTECTVGHKTKTCEPCGMRNWKCLIALHPDYEFADLIDNLDFNINTLVITMLSTQSALESSVSRMDELLQRMTDLEDSVDEVVEEFRRTLDPASPASQAGPSRRRRDSSSVIGQ